MEYRTEIALGVSAAQAWERLAELRKWPDWTPTVESLQAGNDRPVVGDVVAIKQPGRATARYRIEAVDEGRSFRWGSTRGGVRQFADHVVTPTGDASCTATLIFGMSGPIGSVLGVLGAKKIRSMVDAEAGALRAAVEPAA